MFLLRIGKSRSCFCGTYDYFARFAVPDAISNTVLDESSGHLTEPMQYGLTRIDSRQVFAGCTQNCAANRVEKDDQSGQICG